MDGGKRVCSLCHVTVLRADNSSGTCSANPECRNARMRKMYSEGRRYSQPDRARGGKYRCLGCGKIILPNLLRAPVFCCRGCEPLSRELRRLLESLGGLDG
jgi:hypothetical protein